MRQSARSDLRRPRSETRRMRITCAGRSWRITAVPADDFQPRAAGRADRVRHSVTTRLGSGGARLAVRTPGANRYGGLHKCLPRIHWHEAGHVHDTLLRSAAPSPDARGDGWSWLTAGLVPALRRLPPAWREVRRRQPRRRVRCRQDTGRGPAGGAGCSQRAANAADGSLPRARDHCLPKTGRWLRTSAAPRAGVIIVT